MKKPRFYKEIARQKLAYAVGLQEEVVVEMLWQKVEKLRLAKKVNGRPKRMWFDDIRQWTMLKDYLVKLNEVLRIVSLGGRGP